MEHAFFMESLIKEFGTRKKLILLGNFFEISPRIISFKNWMASVKALNIILEEVRNYGGALLLKEVLDQSQMYFRYEAPKAYSYEQISSVGLGLIEMAELEKEDIMNLADRARIGRDKVFEGYIVPLLDYVEKRIPPQQTNRPKLEARIHVPALIHDSLNRFRTEHRDAGGTCFIMMRFGKTTAHQIFEKTIKKSLKKHGLSGLLARDKEYHDDLYPNIMTYMHGCEFGIAVFERLESDIFNPNVALEVGYMFGLRKQVLLLKDRTLQSLHTDLVGKLYREFDPLHPEETIPPQIDAWLSDKGLA